MRRHASALGFTGVMLGLLLAGCSAAPPAAESLSPAPSPTMTDGSPPTAEAPTAAPTAAGELPRPEVRFAGLRKFREHGSRLTAYELSITNVDAYAAELFTTAAGLPACDDGAPSSRLRVTIHDSSSGAALASSCEIAAPDDLARIELVLPRRAAPPVAVYLELADTVTGSIARSYSVAVTAETAAGSPPAGEEPPAATPGTATPPASGETPPASGETPSAGSGKWSRLRRISRDYPGGYNFHAMLSVATDDTGYVHVATEADGIVYLTNRGGEWSRQELTRPAGAGRDGDPSIALDGDGSAWITFTRWTIFEPCVFACEEDPVIELDGIYYVTNRAGGWSEPARLVAGKAHSSVAVRDGRLHVAYGDDLWSSQRSAAGYGTDAGGAWLDMVVADRGSRPQLALDSAGRPHILFHARRGLGYATAPSAGGTFSVTDGPAGGAEEFAPPGLAIDAADRVHAAWDGRGGIRYSVRESGSWSESELALRDGELGGMGVTPAGTVHIVTVPMFIDFTQYEDLRGRNGIWHATNDSGSFEARRLRRAAGEAETEGAGFPSALAVDSAGRPHVVFSWIEDSEGLYYGAGPAE